MFAFNYKYRISIFVTNSCVEKPAIKVTAEEPHVVGPSDHLRG